MPSSTALVFYLADPKTNAPHYIGATTIPATDERDRLVKESRRGSEPVHRWIRSLRTTPLLVTLPHADASVDEQLAVWHTIYGALDLLSRPPKVTAPAELVTKFEEWVNLEHRRYSPLKPVSERRTRRPPKPKAKPKPSSPTPEPKPKPKAKAKAKAAPKPKPAARPKPSGPRVPLKDAFVRCNECGFLGRYAAYKTHTKRTGHTNVTGIPRDKADAATLAEFERQKRQRFKEGAEGVRWRCDDCGLVCVAGGMSKHQRSKGHEGRTRVEV